MARKGNNDRYVVPDKSGGRNVVKEDHRRSSGHFETKHEALDRGREIVRNAGGGELRIANREGRFIDSDTIAPGTSPQSATRSSRTRRRPRRLPVLHERPARPHLHAATSSFRQTAALLSIPSGGGVMLSALSLAVPAEVQR